MPTGQLCRGLQTLKTHLDDLEVSRPMLKSMLEWGCLTEAQVTKLQKTPNSQQLTKMLDFLNSRGATKWSLLVCVFLELNQNSMAKNAWNAVREQMKTLEINGKYQEAMDLWDEFVRRMVLSLDQHRKQTKLPKDRQRETEIWNSIVEEAGKGRQNDLRMWEALMNGVSLVQGIECETVVALWEGLIDSVLHQLETGAGKRCQHMFEILLERTRETLDDEQLDQIHEHMNAAMLKVLDGNQRFFASNLNEIMMQQFLGLLASGRLEQAEKLLCLLIGSISVLADKGAREAVMKSWKTLCRHIVHLPDTSYELYQQLQKLKKEGRVDQAVLEEMRDCIPNHTDATDACTVSQAGDVSRQASGFYRFRPGSRNLALVINNINFSNSQSRDGRDVGEQELEPRDGSDMDELALSSLLKKLGFHVKQMTNLNKDRLLEEIAAFAARPDHEDGDAAVLAVMSHGVNEALFGTDSKVLSFQSVIDCFSNENAPKLKGKPKWISFQACRTPSDKDAHMPATSSSRKCLSYDNIFVTFTALAGREAIRDGTKGTWYIQALKDVLDTSGLNLSLSEIHSRVRNVMLDIWKTCKKKDIVGEESKPTLEVRTHGWSKKLRFSGSNGDSGHSRVCAERSASSPLLGTRREGGSDLGLGEPAETSFQARPERCASAEERHSVSGFIAEHSGPISDSHDCEYTSVKSQFGDPALADEGSIRGPVPGTMQRNSNVEEHLETALDRLGARTIPAISEDLSELRAFIASLHNRVRDLERRVRKE